MTGARGLLSLFDMSRIVDGWAHPPVHFTESRLVAVGKLVQQRAQSYYGIYQGRTGPFRPWRHLADSTIEERIRKGFTPNDPLFRTGELQASVRYQVELYSRFSGKVTIGSSLQKAVWLEFGTAKMPPRPVLGPALIRSLNRIQTILGYDIIQARFGVRILRRQFTQTDVRARPVTSLMTSYTPPTVP